MLPPPSLSHDPSNPLTTLNDSAAESQLITVLYILIEPNLNTAVSVDRPELLPLQPRQPKKPRKQELEPPKNPPLVPALPAPRAASTHPCPLETEFPPLLPVPLVNVPGVDPDYDGGGSAAVLPPLGSATTPASATASPEKKTTAATTTSTATTATSPSSPSSPSSSPSSSPPHSSSSSSPSPSSSSSSSSHSSRSSSPSTSTSSTSTSTTATAAVAALPSGLRYYIRYESSPRQSRWILEYAHASDATTNDVLRASRLNGLEQELTLRFTNPPFTRGDSFKWPTGKRRVGVFRCTANGTLGLLQDGDGAVVQKLFFRIGMPTIRSGVWTPGAAFPAFAPRLLYSWLPPVATVADAAAGVDGEVDVDVEDDKREELLEQRQHQDQQQQEEGSAGLMMLMMGDGGGEGKDMAIESPPCPPTPPAKLKKNNSSSLTNFLEFVGMTGSGVPCRYVCPRLPCTSILFLWLLTPTPYRT